MRFSAGASSSHSASSTPRGASARRRRRPRCEPLTRYRRKKTMKTSGWPSFTASRSRWRDSSIAGRRLRARRRRSSRRCWRTMRSFRSRGRSARTRRRSVALRISARESTDRGVCHVKRKQESAMNADSYSVHRACLVLSGGGARNEVISDATMATCVRRGLVCDGRLTPAGEQVASEASARSWWAIRHLGAP